MPIHPEYPIAQAFRSDDPVVQEQLMQQAWYPTIEPEQALVLTDYNGLRALGRNQSALNRVADTLRRRFAATLIEGPPEVRYCHGDPTLEPYMVVLVYGPAIHLTRVRNDLHARRGRVVRLVDRSMFVLEGEAPLARLARLRRAHARHAGGKLESKSRCHVAEPLRAHPRRRPRGRLNLEGICREQR